MTSTRRGYGSVLILWIGLSWGCAAVPPCPTSDTVPLPAAHTIPSASPPNVALQQKVKAQEKRISELSMQLNLLKRIDHDRTKDR